MMSLQLHLARHQKIQEVKQNDNNYGEEPDFQTNILNNRLDDDNDVVLDDENNEDVDDVQQELKEIEDGCAGKRSKSMYVCMCYL